jgi:hypothetical protein
MPLNGLIRVHAYLAEKEKFYLIRKKEKGKLVPEFFLIF